MSSPFDFDRTLADWLDGHAPSREPDGLTYAVLARTRRMRQLPGWASLERWLPMTVITRPGLAPPLRMAWLLLIGLLTVALVASMAIVGSRILTSTGPDGGLPVTATIPQGDEAVFALATWEGGPSGQTGGDIHTIRADGTDLRQLTDGPGIRSKPAWSPDGTRIAFHRWLDGSDSVVVMDAGGANLMSLATNDYDNQYCLDRRGLAWSPDGTSLIFPTRAGCMGAWDLSIVAADGSSPPRRLLAPGLNSLHAAWSPDGTRLAYLASEGADGAGLYVAEVTPRDALSGDVQGSLLSPDLGPSLGSAASVGDLAQPQWSPDGTELAVVAAPRGTFLVDAEGIYIVKADGSDRRLLTERAGNATWSPDGTQLAFHRTVDPSEYVHHRPCTVRTWIIDADGSDERELPEIGDGCGAPPLWSPDGTRLASVLIVQMPDDPEMVETSDSSFSVPFHLGFVMVDGSSPPVILEDANGSWQPVVAPLPPAPSFEGATSTP